MRGVPGKMLRSLWSPRLQRPVADAALLMKCPHAQAHCDPTDYCQALVDEDDQQVAALP